MWHRAPCPRPDKILKEDVHLFHRINFFSPSNRYTIRVTETGYRGRVLPEEVEPLEGGPEDKVVATLREGDYFGEQSLLKGSPRAATLIALSDLTTFCLTRDKFKQVLLQSLKKVAMIMSAVEVVVFLSTTVSATKDRG